MLCVATLRYGEPPWMNKFAESLDSWCERHHHPLQVWDDTPRGYPCVKFCERDMLDSFVQSDFQFLLYVDADVWVEPFAVDFPLIEGMSMGTDELHREHDGPWRKWCREHFGVTVKVDFEYSNAGVWLCDRGSAAMMLRHFQPPFIEHFQDQHHWNLATYLAREEGMRFNKLSQSWNHHYSLLQREPANFVHFWGEDKEKSLDLYLK